MDELTSRLRAHGLIEEEISCSAEYYAEAIDDRMEDGTDEESAVAALGDLDEIVRQILIDLPLGSFIKSKFRQQKEKSRSASRFTLVMTILGAPLWIPLLITAVAVILSVYVSILAVIISLFATVIALITSSAISIPVAGLVISETVPGAIGILGAALLLMGIGILMILPAKLAAKGLWKITLWFTRQLRKPFIPKQRIRKDTI